MICFTTLGAVIITALITLLLPNIYTARAMIVPSDDDKSGLAAMMSKMGGLAAMAGSAAVSKTTGDLYLTMLRSETIKDQLIDRFKLLDVYDVKFRVDAYKKLDTNAGVSLGKKDGVITIAVNDKDPKRAAELANAYVAELGKLAAGLNMTGAGQNRLFLETRIAEARADLSRAEEDLKAFQSKNKTISVTDQAKATIEGVAHLRGQLALKEVELGTLQRQFTDKSQEVKTTRVTIANLRSQIAALEGKGAGGSSSIPNVGSMPQMGQDYLRLMREFKIQEAVLEMLTQQYEAVKIGEAKDVAPFQILQKAKAPEKKSGPNRGKLVKLSLFVSLFGSMLLALALENISRIDDATRQRWKSLLVTSKSTTKSCAPSERD